MKSPEQFSRARQNLQACLEALDAHFQHREPTADYGVRLLWLIKATHKAWMEASGGNGEIPGVTLAGMSAKLSGAILMGGLLSLSTTALAMMEMTILPREAENPVIPGDEN